MIERNIGNAERIVRLVFGLSFGGWALMQPTMDTVVEWFVILFSVSLMLNGIFSRCYLWYLHLPGYYSALIPPHDLTHDIPHRKEGVT
jgi:Protein of unknown function (DUF2892)